MRNIVLFSHASLDGFVQSSTPWDLGWIAYDDELVAFADDICANTGSTLYGRATYEGMKGYWPTCRAIRKPASTMSRMR